MTENKPKNEISLAYVGKLLYLCALFVCKALNTDMDMKKLVLILLVAFVSVLRLNAQLALDGIYYYLDASNKSAEVTSNPSKYAGDIVIPKTVIYKGNTYQVTTIGQNAFQDCADMTSVVLPEGLTSINSSAFMNCSTLQSLTIPNTVSYVGSYAFWQCSSLSSVQLSSILTCIQMYTFYGCSSLKSIELGSAISEIGQFAFSDCDSLTNVFCCSLTPPTLGNYEAFPTTCDIYVPCGCLSIYKNNWSYYSKQIRYKPMPYAITIIASDYGYEKISKASTICDSSQIYASPDYGYHFTQWSDGNIENPRYILLTQDTVFSAEYARNTYHVYCNNLDTNIGFAVHDKLGGEYYYLDTAVITAYAKEGYHFTQWSDGYTDNPRRCMVTQDTTFTAIFEADKCLIASGTCGENLTWELSCDSVLTISGTGEIDFWASYWEGKSWDNYRQNIREIILPDGITNIDGFSGCTNLRSVIMPNSIKQIEYRAFGECTSLEQVVLSDNITSTGDSAFGGCISLKTIDIPEGVSEISACCFIGCTNLTKVTIPKTVSKIEFEAFSSCKLTTIYNYATTPQQMGYTVFGGVDKSGCTLYVPAESVSAYKAADQWKEFYNIKAIEENGNYGNDFFVTFMRADQDPNNELSLALILSSEKTCQVIIENPYTGYKELLQISAGQSQNVVLYNGNVLLDTARAEMATSGKVCYAGFSELIDSCAIHITSTEPITVEALNYKRATCDATCVLPTAFLGSEYYIQTYTPSDHDGASHSQGSHFAIIATEDGTIVDITPTVPTAGGQQAGETFATGLLKKGQVYYVWSANKDNEIADLSGTHVKARNGKRIAVFQGCPHTNIPYQIRQRDHIFSQAMPIQYWGDTIVLTASKGRATDIVRLMALNDGTEVRINNELVHTFDFATDTKHYWEFTIGAQGTYAQSGSCLLVTSNPCEASLFITSQRFNGDKNSDGDPAMLHISSTREQISSVAFSTITSSNSALYQYVDIVTTKPTSMVLDGLSIADFFQPVSDSSIYYYAQVSLGMESATHLLSNSDGTFTARLYGYSKNESYGFSLIANNEIAEPIIIDSCLIASGSCGENVNWVLRCDSVLTISGEGTMNDYDNFKITPWYNYRENIKTLIVEEGVTSVARSGFTDCYALVNVVFSKDINVVGEYAFYYADNIQSVMCYATIPPTIGGKSLLNKIVYVPGQAVEDYKNAKYWSYNTILPIPGTEVCISYHYYDSLMLCAGDEFKWQGKTIRHSGSDTIGYYNSESSWFYWIETIEEEQRYSVNYSSIEGCDSTYELYVHFMPSYHRYRIDSMYEGEVHPKFGVITRDVSYSDTIRSFFGCDSIFTWTIYTKYIPRYTITTAVNSTKYGAVEGAGTYKRDTTITLTAIPNKGYQFNEWSDGNKENPRQVTVTQDETYTAIFGTKMCSWLVESNDLEMGAVITTFENEYYKYGTQITVEASPNSGYKFVKWNDGKKYNPYKFTILDDKYLLAIFMADEEEQDTTTVQPSSTTATFTWPFIIGGFSYSLTIYLDAACTIPLCTITFNQYGQLIGIHFGKMAPRRMIAQDAGFTYTVSGLDANTEYYFKMETKDEENKLINTDEGAFKTTNEPTAIDQVSIELKANSQKLLINGQIFILRGDRLYTPTGQIVR